MEKRIHAVTGGTSGMGLATAQLLGKWGPVVIGGRSEKRLAGALEKLKAAGVEAYGVPCDVSDKASMQAFADYAASLGKLGCLVNAAGVDFDVATIEQIISINMQGTVNFVNAFLPYLDGSKIVLFSSITGYFVNVPPELISVWNEPDAPDFCEKNLPFCQPVDKGRANLSEAYNAYGVSKRFVMYYTQANATRVARKNASQIFSIAPGSFDTPMLATQADFLDSIKQGTAFKRVGKPEEMADFIIKLLEPGHEYLTGVDLILDGGKTAMAFAKQLD